MSKAKQMLILQYNIPCGTSWNFTPLYTNLLAQLFRGKKIKHEYYSEVDIYLCHTLIYTYRLPLDDFSASKDMKAENQIDSSRIMCRY